MTADLASASRAGDGLWLPPRRPDRIAPSLAGSLALHGLAAALLIFGLPSLMRAPPEVAVAVPVRLVLAAATRPPGREEKAAQPQAEPAKPLQPEPPKPKPTPTEALPPALVPAPPRPVPLAVAKPERKPPPPLVQPQQGEAPANRTVTDTAIAAGPQAALSVKDFLRAQIERHWNFDVRSLGSADLTVSIHVEIEPNGTVRKAEIVDDRRYAADPDYHALAVSARNAVLISSPLQLPPGRYEEFSDIILNFDPRQALR